MASRINTSLVCDSLDHAGFRLVFARKDTICIARPSNSVQDCYEHVRFDLFERGKYADVILRIAIVPTLAQYRNMFEEDYVSELSLVTINTAGEARAWGKRLAELIPACSDGFAQRAGPALLKLTSRARMAARFYLSKLPARIDDLEMYWNQQKKNANPEQRELARKQLHLSLLTIPFNTSEAEDRAFHCYQIAAYTIVFNNEEGKSRGFFAADTDPEADLDLAYCFQVMASQLYGEPNWPN